MNNKINFKKSSKSKIIKLSTSSKELENKAQHTHTYTQENAQENLVKGENRKTRQNEKYKCRQIYFEIVRE